MDTDGHNNYDTPWKVAVEHHFPEFLAFYFPSAHAEIDWRRGYRFLDQELAQVVQDAALGKRYVDKLVAVQRRGGREDRVYIHIEIQGGHDSHFAKRMFTYNYRLFDRYDRAVASLAVLADDSPSWKPEYFGYALFGCEVAIRFPVAKLSDYASRTEDLLAHPNPFALVTAAHLLTRQTRDDTRQRFAAKWRLARLLYERDWDKQRIIDLFGVLDWLMRLPAALEDKLWHELSALERNKAMPYVTSVERIGYQRGREIGLEEGRWREVKLVLRQLQRRLGVLPAGLAESIEKLPVDGIEVLGEALLEFDELRDLETWLENR